MENLIFSLNASIPIFLMMVLGYLFQKIGWMDRAFAAKMNSFVFKAALPAMLFHDLGNLDISEAWNLKFVLFCFCITVVSILLSYGISCLWKDKTLKGEYIQASYRSSAAILGISFIQNIYGTSGMGPLMILGSVPLYNICAVLVLAVFRPEGGVKEEKSVLIKRTAKGIITNPILIGIVVGFLWSFLRLPMPVILEKTASNLGKVATPLGLMAMGAAFDFEKALGKAKPAIAATLTKLVGFCILFLPLAVRMGFRNEELVAILVMLGSSTTVSAYVMARNMDHEGVLTSSVVMLTTLFCSFTLAGWLFLLKSMGYL